MGLLRHSLFIDTEGTKARGPSGPTTASAMTAMNGSAMNDRHGRRQRKSSMPVNHVPLGPENGHPAGIPKRKSLSSILRNWRRDDPPPPMPNQMPIHPLKSARSNQSMARLPSSPTNSVFSTQTAPVQRFPGPGVCSTLPSPVQTYAPSLPPVSPGRGSRVYRVPHGPAVGSTPALPSEHQSPLTISPPIPGVGDVPAHYRFRGEGNIPPLPEVPFPHIMAVRAAQNNRPMHRQSTQTLRSVGSIHTLNGSQSGIPPGPHRPPPLHGLGISHTPQSSTDLSAPRAPYRPQPLQHGLPPQLQQQQQQVSRDSVLTVRPTQRDGKRDTEFIADAEVAALLTDAHIPPTSPVASVRSGSTPRPQRGSHTPSTSISSMSSIAPSGKWPTTPSSVNAPLPGSTLDRESVSLIPTRVGGNGRPSSILSNVSWASISSAKGKQRGTTPLITPRASVVPQMDDKVEALADSTDQPATPKQLKVKTSSALPLSALPSPAPSYTASVDSAHPSPSQLAPKTRPLSFRPRSYYSNGTFRTDSPDSEYSSTMHDHSVGDGSRTPTTELGGSPAKRQTVRDRNVALELTNARLEAELTRMRSEASLRPRTSYMSISAVSTGAVGNGTLGMLGSPSSVASYRSSQITVRDEYTESRSYRQDSRRDSRSAMSSPNSASSNYDLSVPSLLAEIDALRRNGQRLQAELFAVKSQVSLLLPNSTEQAERDALEALTDLGSHPSSSSASSAGTPTISPSKKRMTMSAVAKQVGLSSMSYMTRSQSIPNIEATDGESDASTPSSSASETWPRTPVMNGDWSPSSTHNNSLNGSVPSSYSKGHRESLTAAMPLPMSRIPRASGRPMSTIRHPSNGHSRPTSSIRHGGTPPPRPPRAPRRGEVPVLPPGAAAAVRSRASTLMGVTGV